DESEWWTSTPNFTISGGVAVGVSESGDNCYLFRNAVAPSLYYWENRLITVEFDVTAITYSETSEGDIELNVGNTQAYVVHPEVGHYVVTITSTVSTDTSFALEMLFRSGAGTITITIDNLQMYRAGIRK
ncbi:unnamed protein product, partial [marine sediment metagenome]